MDDLHDDNALIREALRVREHAYVPYSHYEVGAAVLGKSGRIYAGCNVENASYGLAICAERAAIFMGISEGEREFLTLAVVTSSGGTPCGACRQVFLEFARPEAPVIVANIAGKILSTYTIAELLPNGFGPAHLPTKT